MSQNNRIDENDVTIVDMPDTFKSWSQTISIYYTLKHCWNIENFFTQIKSEQNNRTVSATDEADENVLKNEAHPCLRSRDLYLPDRYEIKFSLELYPRGHDKASENKVELYLNYKQGVGALENLKVCVLLRTTCVDQVKRSHKNDSFLKFEIMPGSVRLIGNNLIKKYLLGMIKNFRDIVLEVEILVFMGIENLDSLICLPEHHKVELRCRDEVQSDLLNFLDRELHTQENAKMILQNGFKVVLGACLPWAMHIIKNNFDEIFETYLDGISVKALQELFKFLFTGELPRRVNRTKMLGNVARKLKISFLADAIEAEITRKRLKKSQQGEGNESKRLKTNRGELTEQIDLTQVPGPSGLQSSSNDVKVFVLPQAVSTKSRKKATKLPTTFIGPAAEEFKLEHKWSINSVFSDPNKEKFIDSPKFYSQTNPHVKFSLKLQMPEKTKGKGQISLVCFTFLEGYEAVEVEIEVWAYDIDQSCIGYGYKEKRFLQNNESIFYPNLVKPQNSYLKRFNCRMGEWKDVVIIKCKLTVTLYEGRPDFGRKLNKTGFNGWKLVQKLTALSISHVGVDFELNVGGKPFRVHRAILFARSEHFRNMYYDLENVDKDLSTAEYPTLAPEVMPEILLHIYAGRLPPVEHMTLKMCEVANVFKLNTLHRECVNAIADTFTVNSILTFLKQAQLTKDEKLLHMCFDYWFEHSEDLMDNVEWNDYLIKNVKLNLDYMEYSYQKDLDTEMN